ncbi:MAG TPA: VWA domain-containing protein [Pyrinomonadaceae bacterium]|nr:VWA domain-containing protein [Pyrinomonadaceae bacterium]
MRVPKIEFLLQRTHLEADREQTVDLLIRIIPPEIDSVIGRRPRLNIGIVLDRSGSMGGEKMERAREAAGYCIDQLLPTDRLSLVIFDDVIEVLIPSQLAENKSALKEQVAHIHARNSTALHEAWVRGGMQVSEHITDGAINRVLLITDGQANVGLTNTDEIVSQAMGLFQRGVSTSTIGIGEDFQEDLLMPMAQSAGGNAWHVERADDMQRIFSVELEGLIAQVAHTVSMGLIPSDGVRLSDVLNDFEMNENGRYRLPNLQAGSSLDVLAQLRVPAQAAGTKRHLLDLRLGYTPQEARSAEVLKQSLEVEFVEASRLRELPVNQEVEKAVRLLMNARARREAMAHMDRGDYVLAKAVVSSAISASAPLFSRENASADIREEQQELSELSSALDDRRKDSMTRKLMAYASYRRSNSKKR